MAINTFTVGVNSIEFTQASTDGSSDGTEKYQPTGRDSAGNYYLYKKSTLTRKFYRLSYDCQTLAKVDETFDFFELYAEGLKNLMTWVDGQNVTRQVNYMSNSISRSKTGPNKYRISFDVKEII